MNGCVIFDLGGVVIDWNPRHLYRKLFDDEAEMEGFLAEVCTQAWNERQDEGRPVAVAVAELTARHPEKRDLIEAYYARWPEMMAGPIEGSPAILEELRDRGVPLYALSNFSAETFPHARRMFEFLGRFDGMLISGEVGVKKPDPAIFHILFERCRIDPRHSVYVDDVPANVAAGRALDLEALQFTTAAALRRDLARLGFL